MPEPRSRRALVAQALGRVLGRDVAIDECLLLEGSTGRRSYRVAAEGQQYVVRLGEGLYGVTLGLAAEADLTRAAAADGLAPEVVGTDPATGTLVTRWLADARVWTEATARSPREIARIAALLGRLHALKVPLPAFEAEHVARHYIAEAHRREPADTEVQRREPHDTEVQRRKPHDTGNADLARELTMLAAEYDERFPPTVICHNDLVAENILDTGDLKLIDFEYAVLAHPVLDLASIAAMNHYDARRRLQVVEACYPDGSRPFSISEFDAVVRMLHLLTLFWARAQDEERQAEIYKYSDRVKSLTERP